MNYVNFETGKPCSRTEYIRDGLERGELLYKSACGCVIIQDRTADAYIVYCPKHEVAPELYKALRIVQPLISYTGHPGLLKMIREALAKAEGGK